MFSDKVNINILTALLRDHGVRHVVVCPGSRNGALVHNFCESTEFECVPVTDERSAGFVALGLRQTLNEPVAVCVTSGSALLNLLPAVAEATYRHQGIIVISADRPAAWIGQLDGQTLPQQGALGDFAAVSVTLPEPADKQQEWECNRKVNEALLRNVSEPHPSVHINVPVSEPLFGFGTESLPVQRVVRAADWNVEGERSELMARIERSSRPMVVVGQTGSDDIPHGVLESLRLKMPVLAETLASGSGALSLADQILYAMGDMPEAYVPDTVIYIGGNTVSKRLRSFLRKTCGDAFHIVVSEDGTLHDVSCATSVVVRASAGQFLKNLDENFAASVFALKWNSFRERVAALHSSFNPSFSSLQAVRLFEEKVSEGDVVHYANSMSVRLGSIYSRGYRFCNRGVNGIEGSISTAAGASLALKNSGARVYCVTGDLSFFYDQNALWPAGLSGNFRILLLNNSQGAVFKSLPGLESSKACDYFIAGRHCLSAEGACRQYGIAYLSASDELELECGMTKLFEMDSLRPVLLEVHTDADMDQKIYAEYLNHIRYGMESDKEL